MRAQRGGILRKTLRQRFDELAARKIYPNFPGMRVLMRDQLGGFSGSAAGPNPRETVPNFSTPVHQSINKYSTSQRQRKPGRAEDAAKRERVVGRGEDTED